MLILYRLLIIQTKEVVAADFDAAYGAGGGGQGFILHPIIDITAVRLHNYQVITTFVVFQQLCAGFYLIFGLVRAFQILSRILRIKV